MTTKFWLQAQNSKNKEQHRHVHEHQWFLRITMCHFCIRTRSASIGHPPQFPQHGSTPHPTPWVSSDPLPSPASSDHHHHQTDRALHITSCHMSSNCSHWTVNTIITMGPLLQVWVFSPKENKFPAVTLETLRETNCWSPEYKSLSLSQSWPLLCKNAQELALENVCTVNFNTWKKPQILKNLLAQLQ